jgi:hypothetical protein
MADYILELRETSPLKSVRQVSKLLGMEFTYLDISNYIDMSK